MSWTVDITREQFTIRTWLARRELLARVHFCNPEPYSRISEPRLLDSSSSSFLPSLSRRLPLSTGPQKSLIATRMRATVCGSSGMRWNRVLFFLSPSFLTVSFFVSPRSPPAPLRERERDSHKNLYAWRVYTQTCPLKR